MGFEECSCSLSMSWRCIADWYSKSKATKNKFPRLLPSSYASQSNRKKNQVSVGVVSCDIIGTSQGISAITRLIRNSIFWVWFSKILVCQKQLFSIPLRFCKGTRHADVISTVNQNRTTGRCCVELWQRLRRIIDWIHALVASIVCCFTVKKQLIWPEQLRVWVTALSSERSTGDALKMDFPISLSKMRGLFAIAVLRFWLRFSLQRLFLSSCQWSMLCLDCLLVRSLWCCRFFRLGHKREWECEVQCENGTGCAGGFWRWGGNGVYHGQDLVEYSSVSRRSHESGDVRHPRLAGAWRTIFLGLGRTVEKYTVQMVHSLMILDFLC